MVSKAPAISSVSDELERLCILDKEYDRIVQEHYAEQARMHGLDPSSTMSDSTTRSLECSAILRIIEHLTMLMAPSIRVLDIGCGNGYLLELLRESFPEAELVGIDFCIEMVELARSRRIPRCNVQQGDVRSLQFPDSSHDVVIAERCLINLLDVADQARGLRELWRVLKPAGYLILLEAFRDGLDNLNKAKRELGLPENSIPHHNLWFDKSSLFDSVEGLFEVLEPSELAQELPSANFLSSHYFISRVLYPAVTKADIVYNTEFVRFFQFLPPIGDYSPIQIFLLRKQ